MHESSLTGAPLVRPLFFEFPDQQRTFDINEQFMVGDALLFSPQVYVCVVSFAIKKCTNSYKM
jgi:alpha-glucosidase